MTLDPTLREANIRDSVVKYFVDNINTTSGVPLTFDKSLSVPKVTGKQASQVDRWVNIDFGTLITDILSSQVLQIYVCTRKDNEGFRLAQLRDTVFGYLFDSDDTYLNGMRIPFYKSDSRGHSFWTLIGAFMVQDVDEGPRMEAGDETKFKILTVRLRFASKG